MNITQQYQKIILKRLSEKNPLIQALLGPRQVGKTTAAEQIFQNWPQAKLMVSADEPSPPTAQWVRFHWEQARRLGPGTLLIFDEIQKVPQWSEQIKLLFDEDRNQSDLRVLLLGSSSLYLQKGLHESLAGRFELSRAHHWTYHDFHRAFAWDFDTYLKFGAYPGAVPFADEEERWRNYILNSVIEPVLSRDILGLHPVSKPALFRQTFELAAHYPAQIVSFQKLLGQLQDRGNATTIKHYLELLEKSFLILSLDKYSGSMVKTKVSSPKLIPLNPALINAYQMSQRLTHDPEWYGRVLEAAVGSHLAQLPNSKLFYWREGRDEVDFVVQRVQGLWALEIKAGMTPRSARGLAKFSDLFPKARCEIWDLQKCIEFMESETPEDFF